MFSFCYNKFGEVMKTIDKIYINEIKIQKSQFITILYPLHNTQEINEYLKDVKSNYPNATHYCYSYIFDTIKRFSDDGEPGGTAGMPMLNVLENQNLNRILVVVVRYFGGIKLGAGGLVRAYTNSVSEGLKNCTIIELEEGFVFDITFNYEQTKEIDYLCQSLNIIEKEYHDHVIYKIEISNEKKESFFKQLELLNIIPSNIEKIYIKKM